MRTPRTDPVRLSALDELEARRGATSLEEYRRRRYERLTEAQRGHAERRAAFLLLAGAEVLGVVLVGSWLGLLPL